MDAIETTVPSSLAETEVAVREALAAEGFGVLTEIDVAATLKSKLGVDRTPLKILGACNPGFAHRALELDPSVALMLPCNVVLEETGPASTHVSIADPRAMMPGEAFEALALEAASHLVKVTESLAARRSGK